MSERFLRNIDEMEIPRSELNGFPPVECSVTCFLHELSSLVASGNFLYGLEPSIINDAIKLKINAKILTKNIKLTESTLYLLNNLSCLGPVKPSHNNDIDKSKSPKVV
ncbi:hypothetical protein PMALA_012270 [Plasmodium malariae]|uniref:Uncharacterized protein n=1 Tax=Plasmodium malariae TaxID=5858 RepID=A0A1A8W2B7_PLAMA|nr:hypothetical protein PMALA_012270 [Plasmodium malariae]